MLTSAAVLLAASLSLAAVAAPSAADSGPADPRTVASAVPSDAQLAAEPLLSSLIESAPEVFAGMEYSLDYSKLTVFFKEGDEGRASSLLRDAGLDDEELGLHLVAQKRSLAELRDYRDDVVTHLEKGGVDGRVTIDTEANAIEVLLHTAPDRGSLSSTSREQTTLSGVASELESKWDDAVVSLGWAPAPHAYSPQSDTLPFTMGSLMLGTQRCTAGFPILQSNGARGVLTAGHCGRSVFENPGGASGDYVIGRTNDSPWLSGNASTLKHGDWQIVRGPVPASETRGLPVIGSDPSKVERFVYYTFDPRGADDSDKLLISGMDFGVKARNAYLCVMGASSGLSCGYRVKHGDITETLTAEGVTRTVGMLTHLIYDPNGDGIADCAPVGPGDSGGPVFSTPVATGTANGYAMVSGGYPDRTCGVPPGGAPPPPREIFVARVQGVKVYDPGAAIGGFSR